MKPISTFVHGVTDYAMALIIFFAPELFGFADIGGNAVLIARVVGLLILGQALMTNYELGLFRVLSMRSHLTMDYVIGGLLLVSPLLFNFAHLPNYVWLPHVISGFLILGLTYMTSPYPTKVAAHHV